MKLKQNSSTNKITKHSSTYRKKKLSIGVSIASILILSPFAFYLYKYAPADSKEWKVFFFTIHSGGFNHQL